MIMRTHDELAHDDESGTTLIELTIVLALVSIVGLLLFGFLSSVFATTSRMTKDTETEKSILFALRPLTENVRSASAVAVTYPATTSCTAAGSYPTGYANCLGITIARPSAGQLTCPKSVMVYGLKSDGVLREDRTDYSFVAGVCSVSTSNIGRLLLTNVVNGGTPLFTYFDAFGNQLDPNAAGQTTGPFAGAVTVRVSLSVRYSASSPLLSYTSDLAMRNNR
jgi:type II secretory pathway pseudopilin PulG